MASNATIHDALNLPGATALAARVLHLPITSDAEAFGRVARASERVLVRLAEPGAGQRRALASFVFAGVESELERLGAAPRGWSGEDGLEEIAGDQLYRARLLGCFGIAISFAPLTALADANGRMSPEDSETLQRLLALAEREPLQLYLPRSSAELLVAGAPHPLSAWLPRSLEPGRVATIEYDASSDSDGGLRAATLLADLGAEVTLIPPPLEAFIGAPAAADALPTEAVTSDVSATLAAGDASGADAVPDGVTEPALVSPCNAHEADDGAWLDQLWPEPAGAPGHGDVVRDALSAPAGFARDAAPEAARIEPTEIAPSELAAITHVDAPAADEPVASEPLHADAETPLPPGIDDAHAAGLHADGLYGDEAATPLDVGSLHAEGETPAPADVGSLHVDETPAPLDVGPLHVDETPAPPSTLLHAETPAPLDVGPLHVDETPAPPAVGVPPDPARIDRCMAWAEQLQSMSGPKVHGSIEKAFVGAYLPLRREIAAGGIPVSAVQAADRWAEGFAQSYASAFRQLTGGTRRPRMVRDIVETGVRWLGQHHARQCQLLLVSAMRFDLGQRLNEELERRLSGKAVCVEQTLLWAALPSNSEAQQLGEALGLGRRGRYEGTPRINGAEIESGHVGSRELFRLLQLPAELASPGEHENARLDRLATELADTLAPWIQRQPPDTLVLLFGDHGFHWDASNAGTSAAQRGGALPEQVLVPACGWLLRDVRSRAKTAPGVH